MTAIQAVKLAAKIQEGTVIKSTYQHMVVTTISNNYITGYDKRWFDKSGKKVEMKLTYDSLLNPHYNYSI